MTEFLVPQAFIPPLPVDAALPELAGALQAAGSVLLVAEPGAGKTTRVPLALLDAGWLNGQRIVMLEPRRAAARAAARRMAHALNEEPGGTVGYSVRLDSKVSAKTRIEVVTEGILTRRIQSDPMLTGTGLLIFDEFHERSLDGDLGLALALDAQGALRPDLKLLIMSATLDTEAITRLLGSETPVVRAAGRSFPVATRHLARTTPPALVDDTVKAIRLALAETQGSILAFLPGEAEIRRAAERLAPALPADAYAAPLFGAMPAAEQDAAIRPAPDGRRKVVLATTIAETSLTIDGVTAVVDCGYKRKPHFDPATGMTRLDTERVSLAAAIQRQGRAGRVAPGVCYRLWPEEESRALKAQDAPEILEADLAPLVLDLAQLGVSDPATLRFIDPPPAAAWAQARDLLIALEALDAQGAITAMGRAMAAMPLHPRLAHMVVRGAAAGQGMLATDIAALLSERDIGGTRDCDLALRIGMLKGNAAQGSIHRIRAAAEQIRRIAHIAKGPHQGDAGALLALAYPDRIAEARGAPGHFRLSGGGGAFLPETDPLAREPYLAVAVTDGKAQNARIHLAHALSRAAIEEWFASRISEVSELRWNSRERCVEARRQRRLGALRLDDKPLANPDPEAIAAAMTEGVRQMGLAVLPWSDAARSLQARVAFLRAAMPELELPDLSDDRLTATLDDWLTPWLAGISRESHLARLDLRAILMSLLPQGVSRDIDRLAPARITVPSGAEITIDYAHAAGPTLAVRLQEMFGLTETPKLAGGRLALRIELLSPARRPLAVTSDLGGFWKTGYPEVRRELRGRYPKHSWPENPAETQAVKPNRVR